MHGNSFQRQRCEVCNEEQMQTQIGIRPRWRGFKSWLSHMPVCDSDKSFWTSVSSPVKPGLWHPYLMGYCGDKWVNLCKELTTVPKMTCVSLLSLLFPIIVVSLLFLFFKRKTPKQPKREVGDYLSWTSWLPPSIPFPLPIVGQRCVTWEQHGVWLHPLA